MQSIHDGENLRAQLARLTTNDAGPSGTRTMGRWSERFRRQEELLVVRGWKSIDRSAGARQCISIARMPDDCDHCHLTSSEFELASTVAAGFAVKRIAAELGLEWATARTTLHRALRKLGLRSCAQLPAFWHGLSVAAASSRRADGSELLVFESRLDGQARALPLTSAEREVLQAVLLGHKSQEIALQRSTSVRTVANQLATLFQKFGASSRAELAAKTLLLLAD